MDSPRAARSAAVQLPGKLRKLLRQHASLSLAKRGDKDRIVCQVTGHEMPCTVEAVEGYVSGRKYQRHVAGQPLPAACLVGSHGVTPVVASEEEKDMERSDASRHLVPSKKRRNQLFCQLTGRHVNNLPCHIQRHIQGKRFQRYLRKWNDCQLKGIEFKRCGADKRHQQQHQQRRDRDSGASSSDGEGSANSDMEDLYPPEDFKSN